MTDRTDDRADIIVVGNGMFGSAAVRHLAERGHRVIGIGAAAVGSDIRTETATEWASHQVYSSHNDAGRLTRRQDRDPSWAAVTKRAIDNYRNLESQSGISFFDDVGCLIVSRPGGDGLNPDPLLVMDQTGVGYDFYEPGNTAWQERWPKLDFPDTHYVAFEENSAGLLRPKRVIAAQNEMARRAGAQLVTDTVVDVIRGSEGFGVRTATGASYEAEQVLVAAGAFTNFNNLVPSPVDLRLKTEVIVLGEVSSPDAAELARYPTVKYLLDAGDLDAIYMVSPLQYEDGRYYIKMGANTSLDETMTQLPELQQWFNTDTNPAYLPMYEPALRALWPTINFLSVRTQPCVITYSADRFPVIDHLGDGLYVATAGNGGGAKGSDAWGERAADLIEQT